MVVGLIAWPGPHTRRAKPSRAWTVGTAIRVLQGNEGERGRAMGHWDAEGTCRFATPLSHSRHFGAAHKQAPCTLYGFLWVKGTLLSI